MLAVFANLLAAALAASGGLFYVLVYTLWLKRTTPQNIVIGGAAGAIPPLAGWAAAHGSIGLGAAFLFLIVLLWTPPHFWALALLLAPHYEAAGVPMMPVVRGTSATTARMLLYTLALVAATIAPVLTGTFGVVYLAGAGVLDGVLCALAWRVRRESTPRRAWLRCFTILAVHGLLFRGGGGNAPCTEPDRSF